MCVRERGSARGQRGSELDTERGVRGGTKEHKIKPMKGEPYRVKQISTIPLSKR